MEAQADAGGHPPPGHPARGRLYVSSSVSATLPTIWRRAGRTSAHAWSGPPAAAPARCTAKRASGALVPAPGASTFTTMSPVHRARLSPDSCTLASTELGSTPHEAETLVNNSWPRDALGLTYSP